MVLTYRTNQRGNPVLGVLKLEYRYLAYKLQPVRFNGTFPSIQNNVVTVFEILMRLFF